MNRRYFLIASMLSLLAAPAQALVILQYHHISEHTPAATSTSPQRFRAHLEAIAASGFRVLDLDTVTQLIRSAAPLPDRAVLITFDDSYTSIYETALPLLKKRQWPFVVFANTEPVDLGLDGFLSWEQLRKLAANGAAIANHSVSHPHMVRHEPGQPPDGWRQQVRAEILNAEARIREEVGQSHRVLAYPFGEFSAELEQVLAQLDFIGMGQHSGAASSAQRYALPRFAFGGSYGAREDFSTKLQALPLPVQAWAIEDEAGNTLIDGILPLQVQRPVVRMTLGDSGLLDKLQCYVSGQDRAERMPVDNYSVRFWAQRPLRPGRSRYNCTAASAEPGRFHWFSVPFIRRRADGSWLPEP